MYPEIKKDIRTLLVDTEIFQRDLEIAEREYCNWLREHKINDLIQSIEYLKTLESEVIVMQVDCVALMGQTYQNHGDWQIFNHFHQAFLTLDNLLDELKKMKKTLGCILILPDQMKQLDRDWGRFRKPVNRIQKDILLGGDFQNVDKCPQGERRYKGYLSVASMM